MQRHLLDSYQNTGSVLHRLPARVKLSAAVSFILVVVLWPRGKWVGLALFGAGLIFVARLSRIKPMNLLKRILWLEPFAFGMALMALFQPNGFPIFISMLARSTLCLFCMVLLSSTTAFSDLIHAFRRLRVPGLLLTTLTLAYRHIFLSLDEFERMRRARLVRSFKSSKPWVWRNLSVMAAQLFIRSSERSERVYAAMCARGWKT